MIKFSAIKNDITKLEVDAIVNAANKSLCGGGGVDGAIHRAAGSELLALCRTLGGCDTGFAKITPGFKLTAKYIIHTVGPVWYGGGKKEEQLLASCYLECLKLAIENNVKSIAFPAISCGAYRFPVEKACAIAVNKCKEFLDQTDYQIDIKFVAFDDKTLKIYNRLIDQLE